MEENVFQTPQPVQTTPLMPSPASTPAQPPPPAVPPMDTTGLEEGGFPIGKIIKIVAGVIVGIILLFLLIGFIRSRNQNSNQKVTLTYWGLWEDSQVMQPILDDFHRKYPNITVKYDKQDIRQYTDKLLTRMQNGNGPDVFRFHNTWVDKLTGNLTPLPKDVITPDTFQKTYYPVAQHDLVKNGAIYAIPLEIDTLALYTNSDLFQAAGENPPTTWDDFSRIARVLTTKDQDNKIKVAGAAMGGFDNISHAPDIISLLFTQSGVNIASLSTTQQNAATALKFYTDFVTSDSNVWDTTLDNSLVMFAKGNLSMYFGYSWDYFTIKAMNPNLNIKIVPVPHLLEQSSTLASYWVEGVSAKSPHQKEALLFMQFLSQKETEERFYSEASRQRQFGEPYARVDLGSLLQNSVAAPFVQQAQSATSSFFVDSVYGQNDTMFNSRLNGYLGTAVRSILTGTSVESAVSALSQGEDQVLKQ